MHLLLVSLFPMLNPYAQKNLFD